MPNMKSGKRRNAVRGRVTTLIAKGKKKGLSKSHLGDVQPQDTAEPSDGCDADSQCSGSDSDQEEVAGNEYAKHSGGVSPAEPSHGARALSPAEPSHCGHDGCPPSSPCYGPDDCIYSDSDDPEQACDSPCTD